MNLSMRIDAPNAEEGDSNTPDFPDIEIYNSEKFLRVLERELVEIYPASKNYEDVEISLTFMNPDEIQEINREYRNVNEATDVLSFPLIDENTPVEIPELPVLSLGDIVICPEEVARLHPELNQQEAMLLMIAHSFLHLLGYDHETDEKQAIMWDKQEAIKRELLEAIR